MKTYDTFEGFFQSIGIPPHDHFPFAVIVPERRPPPAAPRSLEVRADMALKFAPFASEIELPFYTALSQVKIDHDKLDDSARSVLGLYEPRPNATPYESCRMRILGNALTSLE